MENDHGIMCSWEARTQKYQKETALGKKKDKGLLLNGSVQFSSVALLCPTLCNPINHSRPGLPVLYCCLEFAKIYIHWVSDAIRPSHPLFPPSPPPFSLSQHQGLFQWVGYSHHVAKVLELQHPSNEYSGLFSFRVDWFDLLAVQGILKSLLQ